MISASIAFESEDSADGRFHPWLESTIPLAGFVDSVANQLASDIMRRLEADKLENG